MRCLCFSLALILAGAVCFGQAFTPRRPFVFSVAAGTPAETNGLYAWWPMDEGTGNYVYDFSGNGFTGSPQPTYGGWDSGAKIGPYCLRCDGQNANGGVMWVSTLTNLAFPNGTVTLWLFPQNLYNASIMQFLCISMRSSEPYYGFAMLLQNDNRFWLGWETASGGDQRIKFSATASDWPQTNWVHYSFVWTPTNALFYTNGALRYSNAIVNVTTNVNYQFTLGTAPSAPFPTLNGKMDEVRIYTNALSSEVISNLYHVTYGQP